MEIPKAKIIIYLLTFAGYAWSGYGSNVLRNLRDAVVAAEGFFGDILGKAVDVAHKLKAVHDTLNDSIDENCVFSCPDGVRAVRNKYHKPSPNGCGPLNMEIDAHLPFPEMTKCCNEHDTCYATCNNDKDMCDLEFKKCLYRNCESIKEDAELRIRGCKATAKLLYTGTTALGCKFYTDAQKESCYCSPKRKPKQPSREL